VPDERFPFFARSGQKGLFYAVHGLLAACAALGAFLFNGPEGVRHYVSEFLFALVATGAFALALAGRLRCPGCGVRVFYFVMRTAPAASWFGDGGGFKWLRCPSCGSNGDAPSNETHDRLSPPDA
jgi:DNA-directed RNA polymerase subunit RPC12/RpoP